MAGRRPIAPMVVLALLASACSGPGSSDSDPLEAPELGACRLLTPEDVAAASNSLAAVDCAEYHTSQTYAVGAETDPYPGDRLVEVTTRDFCDESVSAWLDYPLQYKFAYTWFHQAEWKTGNRRSICWAWTAA